MTDIDYDTIPHDDWLASPAKLAIDVQRMVREGMAHYASCLDQDDAAGAAEEISNLTYQVMRRVGQNHAASLLADHYLGVKGLMDRTREDGPVAP